MQLVPLCSVEWTYDFVDFLDPSLAGDGRAYGQGSRYAYPDARGVIRSSDGGVVLFTLTRLSSLTDGRVVELPPDR